MLKKIVLFVCTFTMFTMCKKENSTMIYSNQNIPIIVNQNSLSASEYESLYDSVLMAAQWGLLDLSKDPSFRSLVNTEVGYEFDGDVNVLLKVLAINWSTLESDMATSISLHYSNPELLTKFVDEAVNGFTYFDMFVYPQIYIPFDDQVTLTDDPVLTLNLNDSTILLGIYINSGNALVNQVVDESFAEENLVWVISMNESLESEDDYENREEFNIVAEDVENPTSDTSVTSITEGEYKYKYGSPPKLFKASRTVGIRLTEFKVNSKNENWANGRSELRFSSGLWSENSISKFDKNISIKFRLSQLNKFNTIPEPNQISLNGEYEEIVENNWCLLFESDVRKKFQRSFNPASFDGVSERSDVWFFRSKQSQYGDMNCHWIWWTDHWTNLNTTPRVIDCNLNSGANHLKFKVTR